MKQYRKIHYKVKAIQFDGDNEHEILKFIDDKDAKCFKKIALIIDGEGMGLNVEDWLVKDEDGKYFHVGKAKFPEQFEEDE